MAAHSSTGRQGQNRLDGKPGFDISVMIVGMGECRWIYGAEEKRDGFEDRGFADVTAAQNDIHAARRLPLERVVMQRNRSIVRA